METTSRPHDGGTARHAGSVRESRSPADDDRHTRAQVLVIDDDDELRQIVEHELSEHFFDVTGCDTGRRGLDIIRSRPPDLVVLDLGLPDVSGLDILRQIRQMGSLPVIILSGWNSEADRVVGLEMGADDYVVKPFSPRELAARVKTVLRRAEAAPEHAPPSTLDYDRLVIDLAARDVQVDDQYVDLTAKEFDLLAFLAVSPRQVFSRAQLLRQVWCSDPEWQSPSTVAEHIHRIRRKIEADPSDPKWIHTMRGAGYRFVP